jgi:uncharacterized cofD-like protein
VSEPGRVVALGGGHGLAASLAALRQVTSELTAVVTVADDGGSSGRLRREFGCLPPGDLRMALAALCGDDEWGRLWSRVAQYRFDQPPADSPAGADSVGGHAVGNLLILALWQLLGDPVEGLDYVGRLLGAHGRVLPMSLDPIDIEADVVLPGSSELTRLRGQVQVASSAGRLVSVYLQPQAPTACPQALSAVRDADWIVLGPGSWFTSVLPHLLVPELRDAITESRAKRVVALNLVAQQGETTGFTPENHLEVLAAHAPHLTLDLVLGDSAAVADPERLASVAKTFGAELALAPLAAADGTPRHDPGLLAAAYDRLLRGGKIPPWQ